MGSDKRPPIANEVTVKKVLRALGRGLSEAEACRRAGVTVEAWERMVKVYYAELSWRIKVIEDELARRAAAEKGAKGGN